MKDGKIMKKIRVGIIGQGRSGRDIHGALFRSEAGREMYEVAAVAEYIPARRERAASEYGCDVYGDYRDLLKRDDIDLVVNSTYSHTHCPITLEALRAGKNVVSEKPFSKYVMECEQMIKTAKENGVTLAIFQQSRFAPYFVRIREILDTGLMGEVQQISIRFNGFIRRWDWQTSLRYYGGCLLNTGPHPLDQALTLLGYDGMPTVFSQLRRINSAGDAEDYAKLIITAPDRPLIDLEINPSDGYSEFTYKVCARRGSLSATMSKIRWKYHDECPLPEITFGPLNLADGISPAPCIETLHWNEHEEDLSGYASDAPQQAFYKNLYDHLVNGAELAIKPESLLQQIRIMELVHAQNPLDCRL